MGFLYICGLASLAGVAYIIWARHELNKTEQSKE